MPRPPFHILLIDDNPAYCRQLAQEAKQHRLVVTACHNLEEGMELLTKNRYFKAVILDGRCFLEKGQRDKPKSNFPFHAIQDIEEIENQKNRTIPYCINTETPADFVEDLEGIATVFDKALQHNEMFEYLIDQIAQLPELEIREQNKKIFDFVDNNLNLNDAELLEGLLMDANLSDYSSVVENLSVIRRLEESFFDMIAIYYYEKKPVKFKSNKAGRTRGIIMKLRNDKLLPAYLFGFATEIYTICSKYGNHSDIRENPSFPGTYTVKSLLNMLFALINWSETILLPLAMKKRNI